jgi:hypothetical protein
MTSLNEFINPLAKYHGPVKPEQLVFNANLQEFANLVALTVNLQTNNKITAGQAFEKIKVAWNQLADSKDNLLKD